MPRTTAGDILLFLYCLEFGILLIVAPWSPWWDSAVMHLPVVAIRNLYLEPLVRGAFTGLGLAHLVLGAHDLHRLLRGDSRHAEPMS